MRLAHPALLRQIQSVLRLRPHLELQDRRGADVPDAVGSQSPGARARGPSRREAVRAQDTGTGADGGGAATARGMRAAADLDRGLGDPRIAPPAAARGAAAVLRQRAVHPAARGLLCRAAGHRHPDDHDGSAADRASGRRRRLGAAAAAGRAAEQGLGIALVPEISARSWFTSGSLQRFAGHELETGERYCLAHRVEDAGHADIAAFQDWAIAMLRAP